jgi:hypothetical protein
MNLWNENRNPVTLVANVVQRNTAGQPFDSLVDRNAGRTTKPVMIPTKLNDTRIAAIAATVH